MEQFSIPWMISIRRPAPRFNTMALQHPQKKKYDKLWAAEQKISSTRLFRIIRARTHMTRRALKMQPPKADTLADFLRIYAAHHLDTTRPYPHIPELLRELEKHEIKCALLSNKPDHDVQELVKRYFPDTFSYASGSVDSYPLKPAPEHAHAILSTLSCPCEEALYVGDSEVDIETAKRSGMHMAIVSWGFRDKDVLRARGASHIFDTPRELERYILNHAEK